MKLDLFIIIIIIIKAICNAQDPLKKAANALRIWPWPLTLNVKTDGNSVHGCAPSKSTHLIIYFISAQHLCILLQQMMSWQSAQLSCYSIHRTFRAVNLIRKNFLHRMLFRDIY